MRQPHRRGTRDWITRLSTSLDFLSLGLFCFGSFLLASKTKIELSLLEMRFMVQRRAYPEVSTRNRLQNLPQ